MEPSETCTQAKKFNSTTLLLHNSHDFPLSDETEKDDLNVFCLESCLNKNISPSISHRKEHLLSATAIAIFTRKQFKNIPRMEQKKCCLIAGNPVCFSRLEILQFHFCLTKPSIASSRRGDRFKCLSWQSYWIIEFPKQQMIENKLFNLSRSPRRTNDTLINSSYIDSHIKIPLTSSAKT